MANDASFMDRDMPEKDIFSEEIFDTSNNFSLDSITERDISEKIGDDGVNDDHGESISLYFELASSLNVELVYIILKSITQFAYV